MFSDCALTSYPDVLYVHVSFLHLFIVLVFISILASHQNVQNQDTARGEAKNKWQIGPYLERSTISRGQNIMYSIVVKSLTIGSKP